MRLLVQQRQQEKNMLSMFGCSCLWRQITPLDGGGYGFSCRLPVVLIWFGFLGTLMLNAVSSLLPHVLINIYNLHEFFLMFSKQAKLLIEFEL
jgi:hypothetical protein